MPGAGLSVAGAGLLAVVVVVGAGVLGAVGAGGAGAGAGGAGAAVGGLPGGTCMVVGSCPVVVGAGAAGAGAAGASCNGGIARAVTPSAWSTSGPSPAAGSLVSALSRMDCLASCRHQFVASFKSIVFSQFSASVTSGEPSEIGIDWSIFDQQISTIPVRIFCMQSLNIHEYSFAYTGMARIKQMIELRRETLLIFQLSLVFVDLLTRIV